MKMAVLRAVTRIFARNFLSFRRRSAAQSFLTHLKFERQRSPSTHLVRSRVERLVLLSNALSSGLQVAATKTFVP